MMQQLVGPVKKGEHFASVALEPVVARPQTAQERGPVVAARSSTLKKYSELESTHDQIMAMLWLAADL